MSIKKNVKSTLLTALLVSSISCGLQASDMIEEEGTRLQITGSYNRLSAEIAALGSSLTGVPASKIAAAARVADLAIVSPVLTAAATAGTTIATYNNAMAVLSPLVTTALATPNYTNILAVQTQVTALLAAIDSAAVTAPYSEVSQNAAAIQLQVAVNAWLALYPAA